MKSWRWFASSSFRVVTSKWQKNRNGVQIKDASGADGRQPFRRSNALVEKNKPSAPFFSRGVKTERKRKARYYVMALNVAKEGALPG